MIVGATQVALMQKMNTMAQYELDCDRIIRMLIALASNCRYHSEQVGNIIKHYWAYSIS